MPSRKKTENEPTKKLPPKGPGPSTQHKTKLMATAETPAEVPQPEGEETTKGEFTIIT